MSPLITNLLHIPAISTGEMLRAAVEECTELGKHAQAILAAGQLVGDDIVNRMLIERLSQPDCHDGFLLDGYPRTLPQAEFLDGQIASMGFPKPTVFHLATPKSVLIERIASRRQCPTCGRIYNLLFKPPRKPGVCDVEGTKLMRRQDDTVEVVKARLEAYERQTAPIIEHYEAGDFHAIPANRPPAEIFRDIRSVLQRRNGFNL